MLLMKVISFFYPLSQFFPCLLGLALWLVLRFFILFTHFYSSPKIIIKQITLSNKHKGSKYLFILLINAFHDFWEVYLKNSHYFYFKTTIQIIYYKEMSESTLCEICESAKRKYKCPKCSINYCSLSCYKTHK